MTSEHDIDPEHCIVGSLAPKYKVNVSFTFYVKLFTRSGDAKETGGDEVRITSNGEAVVVIDRKNGTYACTLSYTQPGIKVLRIRVGALRIGDIWRVVIEEPPATSLWDAIFQVACAMLRRCRKS
ncbi:Hypothetical protein POVN_LOCUS421 [uncultured virus]|nr:Hypothetical protein POVN_LOCUS421 [uncultured virus]